MKRSHLHLRTSPLASTAPVRGRTSGRRRVLRALGAILAIGGLTVGATELVGTTRHGEALAGIASIPKAGATGGAPAKRVSTDTSLTGFIASNFNVAQYINRGGGIPASSAAEPTGNFRLICEFSHLAYDDPIVYPGDAGASHLHMFFGNTGANADSTYSSLRTSGDSTCQGGPINRSAYWAPAVFNPAGKVVVPEYITVYYKGPGRDVNGNLANVKILPAGLRMIAGYDMAAPSPATHFDWYCELSQTKQQTIPSCPAGQKIGVVLAFPTCWDGRSLDSSNHRSHLAYAVRNASSGKLACPGSHPVSLPEFTVGIWFNNDGNSQNWYLSSDRMAGMVHPNGSTFHSDWFGAWDPTVQGTWTDRCINGLLNCSGGALGDGTTLSGETKYTGPMLLDPPPA